jgi:hypothetical protein
VCVCVCMDGFKVFDDQIDVACSEHHVRYHTPGLDRNAKTARKGNTNLQFPTLSRIREVRGTQHETHVGTLCTTWWPPVS